MRYLKLLETQLVESSRELSGGRRDSAGARTRLRIAARRHTAASIAVVLVALALASAAIADAAGVLKLSALWQQNPAAPSPHGMTSSIPSSLASSFAILRAPRRPARDSLPPAGRAAQSEAPDRHFGVNPSLSRFAGTVQGHSLWLVPGNTGSCIYGAGDLGEFCTANSRARSTGIDGVLVPVDGGPTTIFGILPDGTSVTATNTNGTSAAVTRSGSMFSISGDAALARVTIHEQSGQTHTLPAPASITGHEEGPPTRR